MAEIPINADTINKTIDLANESTKETRKELDKTAAKGINKLAQLFWASPIGIKTDVYIAERPLKLEKALKEMQLKYNNNIPAEFQVEPSSYIALKGVNELNYSLDEEHLKEMFENLLISDMDSRKKTRVLPSYIEIIKQLSSDDAKFLKLLKDKKGSFCSIELIAKRDNNPITMYFGKYIIYDYVKNSSITKYSNQKLNPLVTDSLEKEKLIEMKYNSHFPDKDDEYECLFNSAKSNFHQKLDENYRLSCKKGYVKLTALGQVFVDICLS